MRSQGAASNSVRSPTIASSLLSSCFWPPECWDCSYMSLGPGLVGIPFLHGLFKDQTFKVADEVRVKKFCHLPGLFLFLLNFFHIIFWSCFSFFPQCHPGSPYLSTHPTLCPLSLFKVQTKKQDKNHKRLPKQKQNSKQINKRPIRQKCSNKANIKSPQKYLLCAGQPLLGMGSALECSCPEVRLQWRNLIFPLPSSIKWFPTLNFTKKLVVQRHTTLLIFYWPQVSCSALQEVELWWSQYYIQKRGDFQDSFIVLLWL